MEIEKIKTAVEFLKDGQSFTVNDLRLGIEVDTITVTGWSQYSNLENLTRQQALKELEEIKILFSKMLGESLDLRNFIVGKSIQFNLYFDDYGKASIIVCSEINGTIKWEIALN